MLEERKVLHVTNITHNTTEDELKDFFEIAGSVTGVSISKDAFPWAAFVRFETAGEARRALRIDGKSLGTSCLKVQFSKQPFPSLPPPRANISSRLGLWHTGAASAAFAPQTFDVQLSNIPVSVKESTLREMFAPFGTVVHAIIYADSSGLTTGNGKVSFTDLDSASRASIEMNGKRLQNSFNPLSCYLAQSKTLLSPRNSLHPPRPNQHPQQQSASSEYHRYHPYGNPSMYGSEGGSANPPHQYMPQGTPYIPNAPYSEQQQQQQQYQQQPSHQGGFQQVEYPPTAQQITVPIYPQTSLGQVQAPAFPGKPAAVYVGNLPETTCKNCLLYQLFAPYGCIISVRAGETRSDDASGKASKGWYGFINYKDMNMANLAIQTLNQSSLDGNILKVALKTERRKF